ASDLLDSSCWCSPTHSHFLSASQLTGEVSAVGKIGDDPLSASPEVSGPSPLELLVFAVAQTGMA
ncbi:putative intron-encoded endonuclease aI2, partial [Dissostichus eleginoides]